ncbi:MAG TPA: sigma-70 family RNA polymerase sigma factor [Nitriliruptorales bacterium]
MEALQDLTATAQLADVFERAKGRGYVLLSELHELRDPLNDPTDWPDRIQGLAADLGLDLLDDLAENNDTAPAPRPTAVVTGDSVRSYLNEIGRTDLLSAEEEVDLAKRYQAGLLARSLIADDSVELSPTERVALHRIDTDGRSAQDRMIRANLRLVVSVARRYRGRGLDLLDLCQEGNVGLMRAVEKFDHTRGYKFSTYATWWIRQAMTRGLADKGRTVRLPVHVHEVLGKLRWKELEFHQKHGREPDEEELSELLDLTIERLREIRQAARDPVSLDLPVGEEGDATMGELVADEDADDPEEVAALILTQSLVREVLDTLNERERGIVEARFGLTDGQVSTLEEIGVRYGVTRERIRQIEAKTLTKLRHPSRAERLKGLLAATDEAVQPAPDG